MVNNKKEFKWDGKTRVSNETYRKNFNEIFGKKEQDELDESYKQSLKNKKEREK
jgi:adenine specific DNA methylase Mod|tara:strand:+ start:2608 stop:2769 length:162 start_codon:yes stop_codon:yes gene_type:complete